MTRNGQVKFGQMSIGFLALVALIFRACATDAADPIFDDDEEIAASAKVITPADAQTPANAPALVVTKPAAATAEPKKKDDADSTKLKTGAGTEVKAEPADDPASAAAPANVELPAVADKAAVGDKPAATDKPAGEKTAAAVKPATDKPATEKPAGNQQAAAEKPPEAPSNDVEKTGVAAAKVAKVEKAKDNLGQRREGEIGRNEELSFLQSKVTAQMLELEERMYRLSEALKSLEPENASRLLIGVKYAREELIQLQMKEIQSALTSQNFHDAVVEQKQVLAKLQRLEQLLLSPDLDFQLQLERLRLMRELLKRLDATIKEEQREKVATELTIAKERQLQELRERKATLKELIVSQTGHVRASEVLTGPADAEKIGNELNPDAKSPDEEKSRPEAIESLLSGQQATREQTVPLEKAAEPIADAGKKMDQAVDELKNGQPEAALPQQTSALDSLKRALQALEADEKKLEAALADEKFAAMRKEQANTRKTTEGISEMAVQLGDSGAASRSELIRAGGSMSNAEQSFGGRNASSADGAQGEAIASLKYARELLEAEAEKLLNRLRGEIKKRTLEGLAQMLEGQIAIRETTERLGPKVKEGARAVTTSIVALATGEAKLITIGEGLTTLVEETEFGIALPAALRSVTDAMGEVKERLALADASEEVIAAEKMIEEDLEQLLAAMKQLPSQSDGKGAAAAASAQQRERQLNRLIAELKMVRMLQVRVNRDTKDVDQKRPAEIKDLTAAIKRRVEVIHDRQEDVFDVTELLAIERGEDLQ